MKIFRPPQRCGLRIETRSGGVGGSGPRWGVAGGTASMAGLLSRLQLEMAAEEATQGPPWRRGHNYAPPSPAACGGFQVLPRGAVRVRPVNSSPPPETLVTAIELPFKVADMGGTPTLLNQPTTLEAPVVYELRSRIALRPSGRRKRRRRKKPPPPVHLDPLARSPFCARFHSRDPGDASCGPSSRAQMSVTSKGCRQRFRSTVPGRSCSLRVFFVIG